MTQEISNNAIVYAILALNSEISLQNDYLDSDELPEEEREDEESILADLEQAFMEFIDVYKERCKEDKTLPEIDELLGSSI